MLHNYKYKQRNNSSFANTIKFGAALIVACFILSLNTLNYKLATGISYKISNSIYNTFLFFRDIPYNYKVFTANKNLLKQTLALNTQLLNQYNHLLANQIIITHLEKENAELRQILNVVKNSPYTLTHIITTKIYNKNLSANINYLTLKVGSNQGIHNNDPVIANNNLLGRIYNATATTSKILLITNNLSKVAVFTTHSRIDAIMNGNNTLNPILTTFQSNANFIAGEEIVTSGLAGLFPRNIPVGTLQQLPNGTWVVKLNTNLYGISYVHIITKLN